MSIIDDALKGLEGAQVESAGSQPTEALSLPRGTPLVSKIIVVGLVLIAIAVAWWVVSSRSTIPVTADSTAEIVNPASVTVNTEPSLTTISRQIDALTESGESVSVAELTVAVIEPGFSDSSGLVAQLTVVDDEAVQPEVVVTVSVSTDSVDSLTEAEQLPADTVATLTMGAVESTNSSTAARPSVDGVEGITALTAAESAALSSETRVQSELSDLSSGESVASLTDGSESGAGVKEAVVAVKVGPAKQQGTPVKEVVVVVKQPTAPRTSNASKHPRPSVNTAAAVRSALAAETAGNYAVALKKLAVVKTDTREVTLLKARLLARSGDYEQSVRLFGTVDEVSLDSGFSFWFGFARFNLQQWRLAIASLSRASDLNSSDVMTLLYLGMAQQQAGDFRASIDTFHQARQLRPDMPEISFNTGISWWALGEQGRARNAFRHFMRVSDGQRQAYAEQRRRVSQSYLGVSIPD